ncbi:MAG TPA: alpha/beta hydrolase [Gammaproteobacteria bacterium]|nr:alpha/beta hydrolase [Gammaproteobacteria bacterium]
MSPAHDQSETQRKRQLERRQQHRRTPFQIKFLRFVFRFIGPVIPGLMARLMHYLWFQTHRHPMPAREQKWLQTARQSRISFEQQDIALYHWGEGKTILLAHGWDGRGSQLAGFVSVLLKQGYSVLAFDAPGHGASTGKTTNAVQIARLIARLDKEYGPFQAVIAHSLGVPASLYSAIYEGLRLGCFIGISGPGDLPFLVEKYTTALHIPAPVIRRFQAQLVNDFGADWAHRLATTRMAGQLGNRTGHPIRALIVHDSDDLDVPAEHSQAIASAIHSDGYVLTTGLGHRRILRSPAVITLVGRFINGCSNADNMLD